MMRFFCLARFALPLALLCAVTTVNAEPSSQDSVLGLSKLDCAAMNPLGVASIKLSLGTGLVTSTVRPYFGIPLSIAYRVLFVDLQNGANAATRNIHIGLQDVDDNALYSLRLTSTLSAGVQTTSGTFGRSPYAGRSHREGEGFIPLASIPSCEIAVERAP